MRTTGHAEETFRGVILGVFNDFLDGDLEVIRTLLSPLTLCLLFRHLTGHYLQRPSMTSTLRLNLGRMVSTLFSQPCNLFESEL